MASLCAQLPGTPLKLFCRAKIEYFSSELEHVCTRGVSFTAKRFTGQYTCNTSALLVPQAFFYIPAFSKGIPLIYEAYFQKNRLQRYLPPPPTMQGKHHF